MYLLHIKHVRSHPKIFQCIIMFPKEKMRKITFHNFTKKISWLYTAIAKFSNCIPILKISDNTFQQVQVHNYR